MCTSTGCKPGVGIRRNTARRLLMPVTVTDRALVQIRSASQGSDARGMALRIAVRRRSDGSLEYAMGFDEPTDADTRVRADDVEVVVAPTSIDLLQGTTLDFVELDSGDFQFIFLNPNDPTYVPPQDE